jgi:hypothetical protein
VTEFNRVSLYLAVFVLTARGATRVRVDRWLDGIAIAAGAIAFVAVGSRVVPELAPGRSLPAAVPSEVTRLSFPLDYWNGTALFLAIGVPLVLRAAVEAGGRVARAVAVGTIPAIAAAIYLTASRGGALVAVIAAALFVALAAERIRAAAALVVSSAGAAFAVATCTAFPRVVDARFDEVGASGDAHVLGGLLLAVFVATGTAWLFTSERVARVRVPARALRVLAVALAATAVIIVAASNPGARLDALTAVPSGDVPVGSDPARAHLLSGGGSGRWQFWAAAVDEFRSAPLQGRGAGAYESWWGEHPKFEYFVRDAHSVYLETLGDLGLVGLAFLLAAFGIGVFAAVRLLRAGAERTTVAALAAAYAAYLLSVAIDWMWELTAVTIVGVMLLGLLTAFRPSHRGGADETVGFGFGLAALAGAWLLLCAQLVPLLSELKIRDSQAAAARGHTAEAANAARAARSLEPWAAQPYVQLALVAEQVDDLPEARHQLGRALERDDHDWRLWLVKARLEAKSGEVLEARRSLARAEELSPRRLGGAS